MRKHFNETKNKHGTIITARYPILCPLALCDVFISWAVRAQSLRCSLPQQADSKRSPQGEGGNQDWQPESRHENAQQRMRQSDLARAAL